MSEVQYDIMRCYDGVTRACKLIDGQLIDPSLPDLSKPVVKEVKKPKKVISIQERLQGKVEDMISAIEGKVDDFVDSNYKMKYDVYNHLLELGCKAAHARKMTPFYIDCYNELVDVYNKDDEYLIEAWSHLKPKESKLMMDLYGVIVDDLERIIKNATAQRKPRKKKTLSATRLVKTLKYQLEFSDLKLVSINSEKIIGANELWVYNTKYNKLGVYRAVNSNRGLSVKGSTIQHFDKEESVQKTVRKPQEVLNKLTKGSLKKHLNSMKTKDQQLTGRLNAQTILLGVY
jgi:hypothetical protein